MKKENMLVVEYANRCYPKTGDYNTKRYGNDRMNEYIRKGTADAVELDDGAILAISRPDIETRYCFHDEGPDYETYRNLKSDKDLLKNYFMEENLEELDRTIAGVKAGENSEDWPRYYGVFYEEGGRTAKISWRCYDQISREYIIADGLKKHEKEPNFRMLSEKERSDVLRALESVRCQFVKRLESWWKRYGADKLHMWTYWADA